MKNLEMLILIVWAIALLGVLIIAIDKLISSFKHGQLHKKMVERKQRKLKLKLQKDDSKRKIKEYNKNKETINFDALKFEFSNVCEIINSVVKSLNLNNPTISEVYLIKLEQYYKKKDSYDEKFVGIYNFEALACLVKALLEEPVIKDDDNFEKNNKLLEQVVLEYQHKDSYKKYLVNNCNHRKSELILEKQNLYRLYKDDIFLISIYLIEKFG